MWVTCKRFTVFISCRHGVLAVEGAATDPEEDFSGEERMEQEVCQNVDFSVCHFHQSGFTD